MQMGWIGVRATHLRLPPETVEERSKPGTGTTAGLFIDPPFGRISSLPEPILRPGNPCREERALVLPVWPSVPIKL